MNEKVAINDLLSGLNTMINMCTYTIQQSNNKNFRDIVVQKRNKLENLQWEVYLIAKEKGYYVPAAPGGEADVQEVKNSISQ